MKYFPLGPVGVMAWNKKFSLCAPVGPAPRGRTARRAVFIRGCGRTKTFSAHEYNPVDMRLRI
jgi:hypothetical protein